MEATYLVVELEGPVVNVDLLKLEVVDEVLEHVRHPAKLWEGAPPLLAGEQGSPAALLRAALELPGSQIVGGQTSFSHKHHIWPSAHCLGQILCVCDSKYA